MTPEVPKYTDYTPDGSSRVYKIVNGLQGFAWHKLAGAVIDGIDPFLSAITDQLEDLTTTIGSKIAKSLFTAKGQLLAASAAGSPVAVGPGVNGQFLTADDTAPSGVAFAEAPATGPHPYFLMKG